MHIRQLSQNLDGTFTLNFFKIEDLLFNILGTHAKIVISKGTIGSPDFNPPLIFLFYLQKLPRINLPF